MYNTDSEFYINNLAFVQGYRVILKFREKIKIDRYAYYRIIDFSTISLTK